MENIEYPTNLDDRASETLAKLEQKLGRTINIFKMMAHSPNVLDGYVSFSGALSHGELSAKDREQIALILAGFNKCRYCAAAHSLAASKAGIPQEEITEYLKGKAHDLRSGALLKFVNSVLNAKGPLAKDDLTAIKNAGFSDQEIVEIIGTIALNIFTNYFNNTMNLEVDFPKVDL